MGVRARITSTLILLVALYSIMPKGSAIAQSYDRSKLTKVDHTFTIGFERQVYSLYMPGKILLSNKTKTAEEHCNRILLRMRLTNRFRLETGLSYKDIDRILTTTSKYNHEFNINKPCKLSVPLTIQYQLQNERCRLRPYFGAGVQYYRSTDAGPNQTGDFFLYDKGVSNTLKYINIIFTQGLIYDVTPDLQITQSIHIIPEQGIKPVGINLGIGYRIK